jgi:hypothetical protein
VSARPRGSERSTANPHPHDDGHNQDGDHGADAHQLEQGQPRCQPFDQGILRRKQSRRGKCPGNTGQWLVSIRIQAAFQKSADRNIGYLSVFRDDYTAR